MNKRPNRARLITLFWIISSSGGLLAVNVHLSPQRRFLQSAVEVARVEDFKAGIAAAGSVEPELLVSVKNEAGGNVASKMVREGDTVQRGQKLMEFSMVDARMELDRRRSQLADAQREFQKAQSNYRMNKELFKQHAIPRKDLVDAEQAMDKAHGAVNAAQRDYQGQEKKVNQSEVISPISGVVLADKVGSNGWVGSGQELFIIGQLDRFRVRAKVDELDISKIQQGQPAEIQLEAFPGVVFPGVVESLGAQAQQGAFAEIDVMVGITDLKGMPVKPNLSAKVSFEAKVIPGAITIPANCVQYEGNTNFVAVLTPSGTVIKRNVEVGASGEGRVVIQDGLGAGEAVLVPDSGAAT